MIMGKELSLYIHIPFCERKCLYCDFLSFNAEKSVMVDYFNALQKEISERAALYREYKVKSVFFGGGTPSFPDADRICQVLGCIESSFDIDERAEISLEVNPASAMADKLVKYRKAGFNRISIGAQSLNDEELKRLGRLHDSTMFYDTYENARKAGFENINIDVMSALPGQSVENYMDTLRKVVGLKPEHISAYSLIVEEGTPFYKMELDLPSEDDDREMYHLTKSFLAKKGYHRYEISNYSQGQYGDEKYECYHNKVYWRRGNYLGLGLGAASMVENVRWNNPKEMKRYIENCTDREEVERLNTDSQMEEFMFLGLRLVRGVDVKEFKKLFGRDIADVYGDVISKYREMKLLEYSEQGDMLRLTETGLDVSNTVMADFLL